MARMETLNLRCYHDSGARHLRIEIRNELILVNVLVAVQVVTATFFPSNAIGVVLGLPFLLFFPGYTLVTALFPRGTASIDVVERVVLSFGASAAVLVLIGLILNYTPWGIQLQPVAYSVAAFIVLTSVIATIRRLKLPSDARPSIVFRLPLLLYRHQPTTPGPRQNRWDRTLSAILLMTILGTVGSLAYSAANPRAAEKYTEFYVLGMDARFDNYPVAVGVGDRTEVTVVLVNHEQGTAEYRVETWISGVKTNEEGPIILSQGKAWEGVLSFTPETAGDDTPVEFVLYLNQDTAPLLDPLRLWIDVAD